MPATTVLCYRIQAQQGHANDRSEYGIQDASHFDLLQHTASGSRSITTSIALLSVGMHKFAGFQIAAGL